MSTNGHLITPEAAQKPDLIRRQRRSVNSEKARLNGNTARRKVPESEFFWWDTELPGFGLRAFAGGSKSWFVQFRQRGKQKRVTLGRPPAMRAEEARALARAQLAKIALDGLPAAPKAKLDGKGGTLFRDYAQRFWDDYSRHWKPSTRRGNRKAIFNELVALFGDKRVDAICKADILRWRDSWPAKMVALLQASPVAISARRKPMFMQTELRRCWPRTATSRWPRSSRALQRKAFTSGSGPCGGSLIAAASHAKKDRARDRAGPSRRLEATPALVRRPARSGTRTSRVHRRDLDRDEHDPQPGVETATMETNIRARTSDLREAQQAAQSGRIDDALRHLGKNVVEVGEGAAVEAAAAWLALSPADRERTAIYASGRALRGEVNAAVQTGLKANGEIGQQALGLEVLSRVNATREELRYAATYQPGMVAVFDRENRSQRLAKGSYTVTGSDRQRGLVMLESASGKRAVLRVDRLRPNGDYDPLRLFEVKRLDIHAGDKIRWTETDHKRGLINADQARITAIGMASLSLVTSTGIAHELSAGDPMLKRLDLAYALNAHMAQGLTSDRGIAVMDSRERNLSNQQTFLVTVTRLRDGLTLFVNDASRLSAAIARNTGMKRSALETVGLLRDAAATGLAKGNLETTKLSAPAAEREPPEREKTIIKPFEMGI